MLESATSPLTVSTEVQLSPWPRFQEAGYDYGRPRRGDIVRGTVLQVAPDGVLIDIGSKCDGLVPPRDLQRLGAEAKRAIKVGNDVPVCILRPWTPESYIILSISLGRKLRDWERAERLLENGNLTELEVTGHNRGGLIVRFGRLDGFVPASHLHGLSRRLNSEK